MKKILTLLLALTMLLSTLLLAGCGDKKDDATDDTTGEQNITLGGDSEDESTTLGLPAGLKFNDVFNVLVWKAWVDEFGTTPFQDGDDVERAMVERDQYVEGLLGIEFEYTQADGNYEHRNEFLNLVSESVMISNKTWDLICGYSMCPPQLAMQDLLVDLNTVDYIDYTKAWYPEFMVDACTINEKTYFITGDISTNSLYAMQAVAFSSSAAEESGLHEDDLYQMVYDDEWTIEKMFEITQDLGRAGSDGIWDETDFYPVITSNTACIDSFYFSAGLKMIEVGENGVLKVSDDVMSETAMDIYSILYAGKTTHKNFATYETLLERHLKDYRALYSRVSLSLNEECPNLTTDELLHEYQKGNHHRYLETLLFQYGRYLLIASSRTRLPANLQGIWNQYASTPWFGGYANNINVQMNYWMNGPANLRELFIPYINYAKAYMPWAKTLADRFVGEFYPHRLQEPSNNGWLLGVTANAYYVEALRKVTHSGPGMGAMTSLLFWDYYDYTRDIEFLREFGYPALRDMSVFFSRMLENIDGKMLVFDSASPENFHNGEPYHTTGCAFDQQMIYENDKRTLQAAEILGIEEPILNEIRERLPLLDPVLIGESGQVKEYREETTYGSIGDPRHRHVSHLMGLYPGTLINRETPEWLEGAKVTLDGRGDRIGIGGWPLIHRLLLRARTCEAEKALELIYSFVDDITENLWAKHRVFQVEGSLGYVAGVCEMLMQSQAGYIELLPALPCEWKDGSFEGLVARGAFVVDCVWEGGTVQHLSITSEKGERVSVKVPKGLKPSKDPVAFNGEIAVFDTAVGEKISFEK